LDRDLIYVSGNNEDADEEFFREIAASNGNLEVTYFKDFPEVDLKESMLKLLKLCFNYTSITKVDEDQSSTSSWNERFKVRFFLSLVQRDLSFRLENTMAECGNVSPQLFWQDRGRIGGWKIVCGRV